MWDEFQWRNLWYKWSCVYPFTWKSSWKCHKHSYELTPVLQPSMWPSAATAVALAKAPIWSTPAWATVSPAPFRPDTQYWWPPTSPTTSPLLRDAAPSARTLRWEEGGKSQGERLEEWAASSSLVSFDSVAHILCFVFLQVKVRLDCPRGRHHDEIEILTAKACRCDMCRKSRYWHIVTKSCLPNAHIKNQVSF